MISNTTGPSTSWRCCSSVWIFNGFCQEVRAIGPDGHIFTGQHVASLIYAHQPGRADGTDSEIRRLILAEFGAASLLIAAGAVLGRLKMQQYVLLGLLFVPFYALNEWLVLNGGLGLIKAGSVIDTGGSIVIHAFGAIFGLGVALTMTTKQEFEKTIETDSTSDRYSMLGSMMLWIFWPSFCAALVPPAQMPHTVVNVILALCGSTLTTYLVSVSIRKKISIADIANAALAVV